MYKQLTQRQKKLVDFHFLKGLSIAEATRRAGYSVKSGRVEDFGSVGCRVLKTERVQQYSRKVKEKAYEKDAMSLQERRSFLARAIRTPVGELHEGSDLAQEVTITEGKEGTVKKIKALDKVRCLELDAKLAGDFDRDVQVSNPFLFLVTAFRQQGEVLQQGERVQLPAPAPGPAPKTISVDAELVE